MTKKFKKLKWERVGDGFDLKVKKPELVHIGRLIKLLTDVEVSSANWRKNMRFNQRASKALCKWFREPSLPLPGYAYALLSNWFTTSLKWVRESPRGQAALKLWEAMFCAVPEKKRRLTDPKRNDKIVSHEFKLWWMKQQKCQKDC